VVEQGRVVGVLLRSDMVATLANGETHTSVDQIMRRDFPVASPVEPLESVFTRLHEAEATTVPIVEGGKLVGVITLGNMTEYMMIHAALTNAKRKSNSRIETDSFNFDGLGASG